MATVNIDGLDVCYRNEGSEGPAVLFVHGFRNSSDAWAPVRSRLAAARLRGWYLDLPGCGQSESPARWQDCTIPAYARLVVQFCRTLGLSEVILVGHSLGGGIALTLAVEQPELLSGLVLVAPTPADGLEYLTEDQVSSLVSPTEAALEEVARLAFQRPPSQEDFERLMSTVRSASPQHVEGAIRSQRDLRLADRLSAISTPTLVVGGDRDRHIPIRYTLRTAAAIRRCGVQIYHQVGHAPFAEVPDEFAALVEHFVVAELAPR